MEQKKDVSNVEDVDKTESTENTEPTAEQKSSEKTFTQKEFKDALEKEVARKTKNLPSKEDLKAFNDLKESQKTNEEKAQELQNKYNAIENDNASFKRTRTILGKLVDEETLERASYIEYTLSRLDGDFEDNLNNYFEKHPIKKEKPNKSTGFSQNTANAQVSDEKAYLDKKYANNPYYKK